MVQGIESISLELEVDPLGDDERLGEGQVHLLERGELNLSDAGISEGIARSRSPRGLVEPLSLVTGQGEAVSLGVESRTGNVICAAGPKSRSASGYGVIRSALVAAPQQSSPPSPRCSESPRY